MNELPQSYLVWDDHYQRMYIWICDKEIGRSLLLVNQKPWQYNPPLFSSVQYHLYINDHGLSVLFSRRVSWQPQTRHYCLKFKRLDTRSP